MEDRSARMASMLSKEATCMMLSFLKLRMMMANKGRISKLSKPRIWKGKIGVSYRERRLQRFTYQIPKNQKLVRR